MRNGVIEARERLRKRENHNHQGSTERTRVEQRKAEKNQEAHKQRRISREHREHLFLHDGRSEEGTNGRADVCQACRTLVEMGLKQETRRKDHQAETREK